MHGPFPSPKTLTFRTRLIAKWVKMSFICVRIQNHFHINGFALSRAFKQRLEAECFHLTSWRPYWCPKTMKRQPCWCPKSILWELNSFLMQTHPFVPINLHKCWPHEWNYSIGCSRTFKISKRFFYYYFFLEKVWPSHKVHVRSFLDEIEN